jgi:hypothetical protein
MEVDYVNFCELAETCRPKKNAKRNVTPILTAAQAVSTISASRVRQRLRTRLRRPPPGLGTSCPEFRHSPVPTITRSAASVRHML